MADNLATQRRSADDLAVGVGEAYSVKSLTATIELGASSANDTVTFGRIPSNARILAMSRVHTDDLATTGAPTLDIGLFPVDGNITADDDALIAGIDLATAATDLLALGDHANSGLPAWDLVNGQATDPGGVFIVRGTVKDAATNQAGSLTLDLLYVVD